MADSLGKKVMAKNKKAFHDYSIIDTFEAGLVLKGTEVKSIRAGKLNLRDSYAKIIDGEMYAEGIHISPYDFGNIFNVDPLRTRKLLMHGYEIDKLYGRIKQDGLTLIPISVYFKKGKVKVEIGLAKGKKNYDKRQDMKTKEAKKRMIQSTHRRR